ncbi:MAG: hypothetical protein IJ544_02145 [Prevotella sp.]|nr:hypothetical protein [Prevotella sp.]
MKRNFLILMLMALLPLGGWAVSLDPNNFSAGNITYGTAALPDIVVAQNTYQATDYAVDDTQFFTDANGGGATPITNLPTTDIGHYWIKVCGAGQTYSPSQVFYVDFWINAATLTANDVADFASETFTGSQIKPSTTGKVTFNNVTLVEKQDYTVEYGANLNQGNAVGTVKIKGMGNFTTANNNAGVQKTFTIDKRTLASVSVGSISNQTYAYGEAITPVLTVTGLDAESHNYTLEVSDYEVNYNNSNKSVSQNGAVGVLTAAQNGNFTFPAAENVQNATFTISPKNLSDDDVAITAIAAQGYTGAAVEPAPETKWTIGQTANNISGFLKASYDNNTVVGLATVTVAPDSEVQGYENYTGTKSINFVISAADISAATIQFGQDYPQGGYTYDGTSKEPTITVTLNNNTLVKDKDYTVAYTNNKNVGTGVVTITGKGNYASVDAQSQPKTKSENFAINKRVLALTASDEVSTTFGIEPNLKNVVTTNVVSGEDIGGIITTTVWEDQACTTTQVNDLATLQAGTTYYIKAVWATNPAPQQIPEGHTADEYDTEEQEAARANYDTNNQTFEEGEITVTAATLRIVPDNQVKTYGMADPALTYKVYNGETQVSQGTSGTDNNFFTVSPVLTRAEGNDVVNGGYAISVQNQSGQGAAAAANYTLTYETGTLTINKFDITITANPQTILYGSEPNTATLFNSKVKTVNGNGEEVDGDLVTVTISPLQLADQTLIDRTTLGLTLTWDNNISIGNHTGALVPVITNTNFNPSYVPGDVEVKGDASITLGKDAANDATTISNYNGKPVKVKMNFANRSGQTLVEARSWDAEYWNSLVLPFDISVADLSKVLGYAIVNVFNGAHKDASDQIIVDFKLTMKGGNGSDDVLKANKPIVLKTANAIDLNQDYDFGTQTIVAPASAADLTVSVEKGGKTTSFIGTYGQKAITNADNGYLWFLMGNYRNATTGSEWARITSANTWNVVPFAAYADLSEMYTSGARGVIFNMQEADGSTTSIRVVEGNAAVVEGWYTIDGIKLNAAPTKKGIYVNNGKKIVVK